ncbi:MAG TPA: peptidoglycan glycosyltransferase [Candidatus Fimimorpha faecalis]|uniref:Peptidoglycan glycosyltransferase n=1 Tax=Candidatus Fimimorpha faecalis TaxID=2840824 RepID=A0A9D1EGA3_9FIRM|nr:peptidoglycan glycosyltransferase [Candidatus Fimimorpha faecalis]
MHLVKTHHRTGILILSVLIMMAAIGLIGRLAWLMIVQSDHYNELAEELHTRERRIKAARGSIYDANGTVIATNRTVCTISVIYNQIKDPEFVIRTLSQELELSEEEVRKKVEKYSAREIIKTNVDKEIGDKIREYDMAGVKVDEDYKRYYPFDSLASKVLGFTGSDNQGIIGLEVSYEDQLKGMDGRILTLTDAAGAEVDRAAEDRIEPIAGNDLYLSLDVNIQMYAEQAAYKTLEQKQAKQVSVIIMNPKNGEIMAMVNVPEFNLNDPFTLPESVGNTENLTAKQKQDFLNQMWRNPIINDTYEPGSTFKTITAAAALEEGVVSLNDTFSCPGYYIVEDRKIRCHKVGGHGAETFLQGTMNSCNPVFIQVGQRLGIETFYSYFKKLKILEKTGVDLPGEAATIMHNPDNMGEVELATVSFGQSFQLTPLRLLTTISSIINGGTTITPHFGVEIRSADGTQVQKLSYPSGERVLSEETSETMRYVLEKVVSEGGGIKGAIEGYEIGGKTATSEKLPRGTGKYISSFVGFAPAQDPEVIAILTIDEPVGVYYGGTIAAPVVKEIFDNILPYLGIDKNTENE